MRQLHPGLGAIRTWRRWICRAEELHVAIPDSMVLIQALSKVAENLTKHGGSQVGFRIAAARQELEVDRRPTLTTTKEFAEFLQAEAEDLALTMKLHWWHLRLNWWHLKLRFSDNEATKASQE